MAARLLVSDLTDCGTEGYFQLSVMFVAYSVMEDLSIVQRVKWG